MSNGTLIANCLYPPGAPPEGCIEEFAPSSGSNTLTLPQIFNPNPGSALTIPSVYVPSPAAPPAFFPSMASADSPPTCPSGYGYDSESDTCVPLTASGGIDQSGSGGGLSLLGMAADAIPILIALLGSIFSTFFSGGASNPVPPNAPPRKTTTLPIGVSGTPIMGPMLPAPPAGMVPPGPITSTGPTTQAPPAGMLPPGPITSTGPTIGVAPILPPPSSIPTGPITSTGPTTTPAPSPPSITPQTGPFIIPVFPGGSPGIQVPVTSGAPVSPSGIVAPVTPVPAGAPVPSVVQPGAFSTTRLSGAVNGQLRIATDAPIQLPRGSELLIEAPAPGVTGFSLAPGTPYRIVGGGLRARQASLAWADQPPPRFGVAGTPLPGVAA